MIPYRGPTPFYTTDSGSGNQPVGSVRPFNWRIIQVDKQRTKYKQIIIQNEKLADPNWLSSYLKNRNKNQFAASPARKNTVAMIAGKIKCFWERILLQTKSHKKPKKWTGTLHLYPEILSKTHRVIGNLGLPNVASARITEML